MTRNAWFWLVLSLGLAWLMLTLSNFGITSAIFILVLTYLLLRFGTMPLARIIARTGYSIRWKFEMAIVAIAVLFLSVSLISFGSMDFMHGKLHEIQELGATQPLEVLSAVAELEDTNHGLLFSLIPILGMLGVVLAAAVGTAMAWSVIAPVLRMGELIQRMASRDFSQPLQVENNDELGELATQINNTAAELARLHEMGQAELRIARDIQQRRDLRGALFLNRVRGLTIASFAVVFLALNGCVQEIERPGAETATPVATAAPELTPTSTSTVPPSQSPTPTATATLAPPQPTPTPTPTPTATPTPPPTPTATTTPKAPSPPGPTSSRLRDAPTPLPRSRGWGRA